MITARFLYTSYGKKWRKKNGLVSDLFCKFYMFWWNLLMPIPAPPDSNVTQITHHQTPGRGCNWNSVNEGIERSWFAAGNSGLKITKSPLVWTHLHEKYTKFEFIATFENKFCFQFSFLKIELQSKNVQCASNFTWSYNHQFERQRWMVFCILLFGQFLVAESTQVIVQWMELVCALSY